MIGRQVWVTPPSGIRFAKRGVFDISKTYQAIRSFLLDHHYSLRNFQKKENTSRRRPEEFGEVIFILQTAKEVDDYARFHINVDVRINKLRKVVVGEMTMDEGFFQVYIIGYVFLDYRNKWQRSSFSAMLSKIYNNYLIKNKIENEYQGPLFGEVCGLRDAVKESLDLYPYYHGNV